MKQNESAHERLRECLNFTESCAAVAKRLYCSGYIRCPSDSYLDLAIDGNCCAGRCASEELQLDGSAKSLVLAGRSISARALTSELAAAFSPTAQWSPKASGRSCSSPAYHV